MTKRVEPGEMVYKVALQNSTTSQSSKGTPTETWFDLPSGAAWAAMRSAPASLRMIADAEKVYGAQPAIEDIRIFTIWYRADLRARMRVVLDGQNFDILNVSPIGFNEQLELLARAVV